VNGGPTAAGACLLAAALLAGWPVGGHRVRRARVLTVQPAAPAAGSTSARSVLAAIDSSPRRATVAAGGAGAVVGAVTGGPVAAVAAGAYAGLAASGWLRRRQIRMARALRIRRLDELCALAADLRAGMAPPVATGPDDSRMASTGDPATDRLTDLTQAARRLADETGAPLADLLDRIEADARAADRTRAAALAQAAGARVTALLLAALPGAGIALGYGLGVDPMAVLLRTPLGAACAVTAIVLQIAGLTWSRRLVRVHP
jgi:tight adherence protein B